jgi:hypothetical protein
MFDKKPRWGQTISLNIPENLVRGGMGIFSVEETVI